MIWSRKPNILLVGDSPFLDTGLGRVLREIGSGLAFSGQYNVAAMGFFHKPLDRVVPFHVFPVWSRDDGEKYGQKMYDDVVRRFHPDVVLTIHEAWAVSHIASRPRKHALIGYFPIDGIPVSPRWSQIFAMYDKVVAYGKFGADGIRDIGVGISPETIPHGVDLDVFKPLPDEERLACKKMLGHEKSFIVGCVARNNVRKRLDRLVGAFHAFRRPWQSCPLCGYVMHQWADEPAKYCGSCGSFDLLSGEAKEDAYLYLHCKPTDSYGLDLPVLVNQYHLAGHVGMPAGMDEGDGCNDAVLSRVYNGLDVFVLPTGGEGWGLPILEAMACGIPTLVTNYSGHLDFCVGASELIDVETYITMEHNTSRHALTSIEDTTRKLDRFYMSKPEFLRKWGGFYRQVMNISGDLLDNKMSYGKQLRDDLAKLGHDRAQAFSWESAHESWDRLIRGVIGYEGISVDSAKMNLEVV